MPSLTLAPVACSPGRQYPALTFLQPTGNAEEVTVGGVEFMVVEVEARISSN